MIGLLEHEFCSICSNCCPKRLLNFGHNSGWRGSSPNRRNRKHWEADRHHYDHRTVKEWQLIPEEARAAAKCKYTSHRWTKSSCRAYCVLHHRLISCTQTQCCSGTSSRYPGWYCWVCSVGLGCTLWGLATPATQQYQCQCHDFTVASVFGMFTIEIKPLLVYWRYNFMWFNRVETVNYIWTCWIST